MCPMCPMCPICSLTPPKISGTCMSRCPFMYRTIVKRHAIAGSRLGRYAETGPAPGFQRGRKFPGRTFPGKFSTGIFTKIFPGPRSKKISRDLFRNEVHLQDSLHELRVGNNGKFTSVSDVRVLRSGPQKGGSFPFDRATPPAPSGFASQ